MNLVIVTPIRLFGDSLAACFRLSDDIVLHATHADLGALRRSFEQFEPDAVLIDVTQGIDLDEVRSLATQYPQIVLVALGLVDQRQAIIRCGRAGFSGYIERDASVKVLKKVLKDVVAGRLDCSAEVSGGLLRALFQRHAEPAANPSTEALTKREGEVLQLIGDGLSNKEIASGLTLSVATVKHHVHHILQKLKLCRRAQAMRRVREAPWIAASPTAAQRQKRT